jgi:carbonic anhydrase/acetyltransferase-like protein (isoleucine patch superfamily)
MLGKLSYYIRRRETPAARFLYVLAKRLIGLNVPAIRILHRPMYHAFVGVLVFLRWLKQKLFFEPMFRSMCTSCGRGLCVDMGLPQVSSFMDLHIGDNVALGGGVDFFAPAINERPQVKIGDRTQIGVGSSITAAKSVTIGTDCLIAQRVWIADTNGHPLSPARRHQKVDASEIAPVTIGNNVWIGAGAFIGPGSTIGDGSIVASNSVVTGQVPANVVVIGSPARVVRMLNVDGQ